MSEKLYDIKPEIAKNALIDQETYQKWYEQSINDPETFWGEHGKRIDWFKPFTKVKEVSYDGEISIKWYSDGVTNVAYNCIDRHLKDKADKVAIIWEGDNPYFDKKITYRQLHEEVCRLANVLKSYGLKKGDRVTIYLPMIPEAVYSMLACARIGLVHSVVFAGFSAESLANRILDCDSKFIITADEGLRGSKKIELKNSVDEAIKIIESKNASVDKVLVVRRTYQNINWVEGRDLDYREEVNKVDTDCPVVEMNAEDPLFILYTSGSTGKPKGVLHTTAGYLVYASMTHQYVFDYHDEDIYWCAADVGWITGHSYVVYGPLANGATTIVFEGTPTYPDASRLWKAVDKHKVTIFYTAPTAVRALMGAGNEYLADTSRDSLRILATVGEPINPEAWVWYYEQVGHSKSPIMDTWWQTETGGHCITPLPGAIPLKAGSATLPFFGIKPQLVESITGEVIEGEGEGSLCITDSWPGQMRGLYNDYERFVETYFNVYKGKYFSGDCARRDSDGYYWITGRMDDVLNVSGHRLGTAEIESALVSAPEVSEAAVIGVAHPIKGQAIYCFVSLMHGLEESEELVHTLKQHVRKEIGALATPDYIQFAANLPKTRSGKIMRRILRKILENKLDDLGDISTLAETDILQNIIDNRRLTY